jgi:hypothetical protein
MAITKRDPSEIPKNEHEPPFFEVNIPGIIRTDDI